MTVLTTPRPVERQIVTGVLHIDATDPRRPHATYTCHLCGEITSTSGTRDFGIRAADLRIRHRATCPTKESTR